METMKKLNQEGYEDLSKYDKETGKWNPLVHVDPKTGKKSAPKDNVSWVFPDPESGQLSRKDKEQFLAATEPTSGAGSETSLDLGPNHGSDRDAAAARLKDPRGDNTKPMRKVAEIDFGGPGDETTTMVYNDDDTIPDAASTTEMVDALSDQVIAQLEDAGALPLDLSNEEAKDKVEDALMNVLKDMDATDWHKQDRGL